MEQWLCWLLKKHSKGGAPNLNRHLSILLKTLLCISEAEFAHPAEEGHFGRLYPESQSFNLDQYLLTIDGW